MAHTCERCGAVFKGPSWKVAESRHMARKNPCDRPANVKYVREPQPLPVVFRNRLGNVNVAGIEPPQDGPYTRLIPRILKQVFERPENQCIVWPNIHKEELLVLLNEPDLVPVNLDQLTILLTIVVHNSILPNLRTWSRYDGFKDWLWRTTLVDLDNNVWTGDMSTRCEYFQSIRNFAKQYFGRFPHKRSALRNLQISLNTSHTPALE